MICEYTKGDEIFLLMAVIVFFIAVIGAAFYPIIQYAMYKVLWY